MNYSRLSHCTVILVLLVLVVVHWLLLLLLLPLAVARQDTVCRLDALTRRLHP